MTKLLFICHGNICRSPMAEYMLKDMVARKGLQHQFHIESAATSREEIGNDIHRGTKAKLREAGIPLNAVAPARLHPATMMILIT